MRVFLTIVLVADLVCAGMVAGVVMDGGGDRGVVAFFGGIQLAVAIACLGGLHTSIANYAKAEERRRLQPRVYPGMEFSVHNNQYHGSVVAERKRSRYG